MKSKRFLVSFLVLLVISLFAINVISLSAATPDYIVVFIPEEKSNRGYYPVSLYRDSSTYCWICNSGKSEYPADYIFEFYVPGSYNDAYKKLNKLRITGTGAIADCYIPDKVAARVYKNNTIRVCIGYWSVVWCQGIIPYLSDVAIWMTK